MNDTTLGKELAITLLQKLSTDDEFRLSYEKSPAAALRAIGVPAEVIKSLPGENFVSHKLNSKAAFAAALTQVRDEVASVYLCLIVPTVRLNAGPKAAASSVSTSFSAS